MNRPIATWILLAGYLLVFVQFRLHEAGHDNLILAGAAAPVLVVEEPWRLLTAAFAHIGILHLLFNSYFLYHVGPVLERELGIQRFVILYVVTAIGGNVATCMLYLPEQLGAGGSTALFGMLGGLLAMTLRHQRSYRDFFDSAVGRSVLTMIVANLVIGWVVPVISNTAHIGGLITGFLLVFYCFKLPTAGGRPMRPTLLPAVATWLLLASTAWFATQPCTRLWYQVHENWTAERERAFDVRLAVEARGFSKDALDFLESLGRFRDGLGNAADEDRLQELTTVETLVALESVGIARRTFLEFFTRLQAGDRDAYESVPEDPWSDTARRNW